MKRLLPQSLEVYPFQHNQINTSLSLTFLAKHLPLAGLFPSISGLKKLNLIQYPTISRPKT